MQTKITIRRRRAIVYETAVTFSQLSPEEMAEVNEALHTPDPYAVLRAKCQHMADLLGCTEDQAERLILDRVGFYDEDR